MDKLFIPSARNTVRSIFSRAALSEEEEQVMSTLAFQYSDRDKPLSNKQYQELCGLLRESSLFLDLVCRKSKSFYNSTIGYLKQEGLFEDTRYAIADSGWTGSMQHSLRQLLNHAGYSKALTGFYFGLLSEPKTDEDGIYHSMYFNAHSSKKDKIMFNNNLFECWLSAPHAMTKGYDKESEEYVPVFGEATSDTECALIDAHIAGIMNYVSQCSDVDLDPQKIDKNVLTRIRKILQRIMVYPTENEALAYGQFMFSDDVCSEGIEMLVSAAQIVRLKNYLLVNRVKNKLFKNNNTSENADFFWAYGTLAFVPKIKRTWYLLNMFVWEWLRYTVKSDKG